MIVDGEVLEAEDARGTGLLVADGTRGAKASAAGASGKTQISVPQGSSFVNPVPVYLATLGSSLSVVNIKSRLDGYAVFMGAKDSMSLEWRRLDYASVLAYRLFLQHKDAISKNQEQAEGLQVSSINTIVSALRGVAEVACNLGVIDAEKLRAIRSIKPLRGSRKPAGRSLERDESRALLAAVDDSTPQGSRDKAILALLLGCGLRRAEVPGIRLEDVDLNFSTITLIGKGNKERKVFLSGETLTIVKHWLRDRGPAPGYLFGRFTKGGKTLILSRPLSAVAVSNIVEAAWNKACEELEREGELGLKPLGITPHDLRRTFATRLLEQNVDIVLVKNLMGHANVATTANYDRRGDEAMRMASRKMTL